MPQGLGVLDRADAPGGYWFHIWNIYCDGPANLSVADPADLTFEAGSAARTAPTMMVIASWSVRPASRQSDSQVLIRRACANAAANRWAVRPRVGNPRLRTVTRVFSSVAKNWLTKSGIESRSR